MNLQRTLVVLILGALSGCGSSDQANGAGIGSLRVPLAATAYEGVHYVLCQGKFTITGYSSGTPTIVLDASAHKTEAYLSQDLPSGDYEVALTGWELCKATGDGLTPVAARLISNPEQGVTISPLQASYAYYQFEVAGEKLAFDGQLMIQISVRQATGGATGTGGFRATGGYYAGGRWASGGITSRGGSSPTGGTSSGGSAAYSTLDDMASE